MAVSELDAESKAIHATAPIPLTKNIPNETCLYALTLSKMLPIPKFVKKQGRTAIHPIIPICCSLPGNFAMINWSIKV